RMTAVFGRWPGRKALDHDLVGRDGELGFTCQLLLDGFDDVVREERLAVVLADVSVGHEAGLAAEVARELSAVIVLDDDGVFGLAEDVDDGVAMQRNEPADGQVVDRDAGLAEQLAGLVYDTIGRAPADER